MECAPESQSTLKRSKSYRTFTGASSAKRRRISLASSDWARELQGKHGEDSEAHTETVADRFISERPKQTLPLSSTPRTSRISRVFELTGDRVLRFAEPSSSTGTPSKALRLLRFWASGLSSPENPVNEASVTANLATRKYCTVALDADGLPFDTFGDPISWSLSNCITIITGNNVCYKNLDTGHVAYLCKLNPDVEGSPIVIEWGGKVQRDTIAVGTTTGSVQLWDATTSLRTRSWCHKGKIIGKFTWNDHILVIGKSRGKVSLYDVRAKDEVKSYSGHDTRVCAASWSIDGNYLATGDSTGSAFMWDSRACKPLGDEKHHGAKLLHFGAVKTLTWCPWKADLLASGSNWPDGAIRLWSSQTSAPLMPIGFIPLDNSVFSLQWSQHCRELLSTHGSTFEPVMPRRGRPLTSKALSNVYRSGIKTIKSPLDDSIAVHEYPSTRRLLVISHAHQAGVTQSCLSPDGTSVFTASSIEGNLKMWKVWKAKIPTEKKDSVFDTCTIR